MSLRPERVGEIPAEIARVARAAFPKGTVVTRLRDEFDALYEDEDFRALYPARGPTRLAPVAAGACDTLSVPREPQGPAGRRCGARPHRLEVCPRARADQSGLSLQRARRVSRPPRRRRGRTPAAGHHAGALQG